MRFLGRFIAAVALGCCLPIPGSAQPLAPRHNPGFPHDWSHRHLIFSKPPAALKNPSLRYSMQQAWRQRQLTVTGAAEFDARALQLVHSWGRPAKTNKRARPALARDWAMSMGTSGTVGEGMYPAKYSFNTGSANCGSAATPDFVVYNTGPAGAATGVVTFSGTGALSNDTVTIGGTTYIFETGCSGSTPANCIVVTSSPTADGSTSGLQAALADNMSLCSGNISPCFANVSGPNSSVTVTASRPSTGPEAVTLTAIPTGAAGNSTPLSATAEDGEITVSGFTGGVDDLATIIAYDNLYTGCGRTVPQVYWQYNTGYARNSSTWDNSVAGTSVVLSLDGTQVAFVQNAGGVASLVILKWAANGNLVQMNTSSTNVTAPNYHGCTAPCMTRIAFGNSAGDSHSSPFYDYNADALYVGDNAGVLHKFTGIFGSNTPAEASSPWPITVSSGATLSGPVYDSNTGTSKGSGNIYVGDSNGLLWYVRESSSTVGTCLSGSPPCLGQDSVNVGNSSLRPIVDAPIVDSSSEKVFAFIGCSGSPTTCGNSADSVSVVQSPVDLGTGTVVTGAIGISSRESNTFDGDFDNNYYSGNYANGHLYACGNLIGGTARTLYQLSFTAAGQLSTPAVKGPALGLDATSNCSGVTEIFNGATDRIFMSVLNAGIPSSCTNSGCLMSFVVTAWTASTSYVVGQEILDSNGAIEDVTTGGTSGSTQPTWPTLGNSVTDGSVHWQNQGPFLGTTSPWQAGVTYGTGTVILDSNFNIEKVTSAGMSGLTQPTWPTTVGGTVVDKQVTWTNEGPGNANLAASGGASGVIMDNTVGTALSGASQVYFSPLLNGTCDAISSVGCAIQASQQGL